MPSSQQAVSETIILYLKEGVSIENASSSPAVQNFIQLTGIVKSQRGYISQFWGHQVESPNVFVWVIDWESTDDVALFENSAVYNVFLASMSQIFELEKAAPLTMYTHFTSSTTVALTAPVTEVAFFAVPNSNSEEAKALIEEDEVSSTHPVITVGKSWGGAVGWVSKTKNTNDVVASGHSIALHGVFGYASVDDHVKWRQTREHAQVLEEMARSPLGRLDLGNPKLPGGNIFVPDSSMFHVRFVREF